MAKHKHVVLILGEQAPKMLRPRGWGLASAALEARKTLA